MNKTIVIPILNNEYKVIVCWGTDSYTKRVGRDWGHNIETVLGGRRGATYYNSRCHPMIVLEGMPKTPTQIGTLAHEAVHAVTDIFTKIGEQSSDEILAHSVGAVVREIMGYQTALKPAKKRSKKALKRPISVLEKEEK